MRKVLKDWFTRVAGSTAIQRDILFTNPVPNNVWRSGTQYTGTITVPTGTTLVGWVIKDNRTRTGINSGATSSVTNTFTFASMADSNEYDLLVTVNKAGTMYTRIFDFEMYCLPALFTKAQANAVWDLSSAVGNKDGAWTDRTSGYKIWVENAGNGRLNPYYWYSSDPTKWIHVIFDPNTCSLASSTFNFTPGASQNVIWDGCADPNNKYGMRLTKNDGGTDQLFYALLSDSTRNSKNWIICGFECDGRSVAGDFVGFQTTTTNNTTNYYDTYTCDKIRAFNIYVHDVDAEMYYLGHLSDAIEGARAYSPFSNCSYSRLLGINSGNDGLQISSHFDSKLAKSKFVNPGIRNQQVHRNGIQLGGGCQTLEVYACEAQLSKDIFSYQTGRRGQTVRVYSNMFSTTGRVSGGANVFIKVIQNDTYATIDSSFTHNTIVMATGIPFSLYDSVPDATTVFDELLLSGNLITTDTATQRELVDGFDATNLVLNNYQTTNLSGVLFVDAQNRDYHLSSLLSPAFTTVGSLTNYHERQAYDFDGYEYKVDVMGADSGAKLLMV